MTSSPILSRFYTDTKTAIDRWSCGVTQPKALSYLPTYLYTVFQKVVHQAHIDNLVNSQWIFIIPSLAHSLENLR